MLADTDLSRDYALVGPTDDRVHEIRTTRFPFNTVCHLGRDFGDGLWRGCSGVLIGPRTLLTAAHCLYSLKLGRAPKRIRVMPGRADRDRMPYGTGLAAAAYVPRRFVRPRLPAERRGHDYGVITLVKPFRRLMRYLPARALSDQHLAEMNATNRVTVAGYPADRPVGTLWRHTERLRRITPRRLTYSVDTCGGHSGSPVWVRQDEGAVLIGIHTSGILDRYGRSHGCAKGTVLAPPGRTNSGVRLTAEVLANVRNPEPRGGGSRVMLRVL
jgi:V8-like Glu-specific endopeptidase